MKNIFQISVENITIKFAEKEIFKKFSLNINKGEKILICAPSGKGKSTFLKVLMGFEKINFGKIFIEGLELNEKNIKNIRENLGYLPQNIHFQNLKVCELINEILNYKNNKKGFEIENKINYLISYFSLEKSILQKKIENISGGEKQRIGFIMMILLDKKIWILDEITSSLDQDTKEKVIEYIINTNKTVIMVSHDKIKGFGKFRRVEL